MTNNRYKHAGPSAGLQRLILCLLALAVLLSGCDWGSKHKVTIRFWNGFTGPDGRTMLRLIKRFNKENPDVNVLMQRMDWPIYYNKLFVAGLGKRAPELFVIHSSNLERFLQAEFIRPVDDLMQGQQGIDAGDFAPNVWKAVERSGKHFAIPLDVHIQGTFYNRKLLREAGVVNEKGEPAPPKTREEFLQAVQKITNIAAESKRWGYVFTWQRTNLYTVMSQFGGRFFNDDYSRCELNCAENVKALEFCCDLIRKYKVAPAPENFDAWIGFRQGNVGIAFEGIYMLADLEKQKDLDFAAAPLPQLGAKRAAWADSHTMCMRKDLEGEKLQATWKLVKFLSDNSLDWAEGGQVPVRTSLAQSERFKKMSCQYEFSKQINEIVYMPRIPFIFEFQTEFDLALEKALRGSVTPKQALDEATEKVNKILERRRAMLAAGNKFQEVK